ncbi:hypothetical protein HZA97_05975 [Candidatus Woesearchaeota archaeon]|nr:hypothetical protein [Candidatus Woesearchaeota archaeon]
MENIEYYGKDNSEAIKSVFNITKLEGLLMSIDGVRVSTEQNSDTVTSQSVVTDLKILVQDETGKLKEVPVSFPGVVLPDSIGNWVSYQIASVPKSDGKFFSFGDTRRLSSLATLQDEDSGRRYSGLVEVEVNQESSKRPVYLSHEFGHMRGYGGGLCENVNR